MFALMCTAIPSVEKVSAQGRCSDMEDVLPRGVCTIAQPHAANTATDAEHSATHKLRHRARTAIFSAKEQAVQLVQSVSKASHPCVA
jgi:hypothetical protein